MLSIKKQIVTDEASKPVAVVINYHDWQRIEALLPQLKVVSEIQEEAENSKVLMSYAGTISLAVDPLEYQQKIRDEWS